MPESKGYLLSEIATECFSQKRGARTGLQHGLKKQDTKLTGVTSEHMPSAVRHVHVTDLSVLNDVERSGDT